MTFTTFVMFDMFNALCCRSADKIVPQMDMFANKAFLYSVGGSLVGQVRVCVAFDVGHTAGTPVVSGETRHCRTNLLGDRGSTPRLTAPHTLTTVFFAKRGLDAP